MQHADQKELYGSGRAVMSSAAVWTPASTRTRSSRCSSSSMSATNTQALPTHPSIPDKADFKAVVALKGKPDIDDKINKKIIAPLAVANQELNQADFPDFNTP